MGSWRGGSNHLPTRQVWVELWASPVGFGAELCLLKGFPLFSELRMAAPDTIILLTVDYHAAIESTRPRAPCICPWLPARCRKAANCQYCCYSDQNFRLVAQMYLKFGMASSMWLQMAMQNFTLIDAWCGYIAPKSWKFPLLLMILSTLQTPLFNCLYVSTKIGRILLKHRSNFGRLPFLLPPITHTPKWHSTIKYQTETSCAGGSHTRTPQVGLWLLTLKVMWNTGAKFSLPRPLLPKYFTLLPSHPHVHSQSEWTIPVFAFPAAAGTHLLTPEGWKAE